MRELEVGVRLQVWEVRCEAGHVCGDGDAEFGNGWAGNEFGEGGIGRDYGLCSVFGEKGEVEDCDAGNGLGFSLAGCRSWWRCVVLFWCTILPGEYCWLKRCRHTVIH